MFLDNECQTKATVAKGHCQTVYTKVYSTCTCLLPNVAGDLGHKLKARRGRNLF